jgi:hypothetical protein
MEDILNFLYEGIDYTKENMQTYIAKKKSKVLICIPSAKKNLNIKDIKTYLLMNNIFRGYTGVTYPDITEPYRGQVGKLYWFGIDIDSNNRELSLSFVPKIIAKLGYIISIRTSTSGRGLHLFIRLKIPITYKCDSLNYFIKKASEWIIVELNNLGISCDKKDNIHICKIGGNFFLIGGEQETLHFAKEKLDQIDLNLDDYYISLSNTISAKTKIKLYRIKNKNIMKFIEDLKETKQLDFISKNEVQTTTAVNLGIVFDLICNNELYGLLILENMKSNLMNDDINGYINIQGNNLIIFEFNSQKIIFKMQLYKEKFNGSY